MSAAPPGQPWTTLQWIDVVASWGIVTAIAVVILRLIVKFRRTQR